MTQKHDLIHQGFTGFLTIGHLRSTELAAVDTAKGVYVLLREAAGEPRFVTPSPAGWFKGRDPTVPVAELRRNWVPASRIVYIGKAGGKSPRRGIRKRLAEYLAFGAGEPIGHWGGRYVWQLADAEELVVCWRVTGVEAPLEVERRMRREFRERFGRLPFANLV